MESMSSVEERAGAEDCCKTEKNLLIFTYSITMKGILEYLTPDAGESYWSKHIGNCAVYTAQYRNERFSAPVPFQTE